MKEVGTSRMINTRKTRARKRRRRGSFQIRVWGTQNAAHTWILCRSVVVMLGALLRSLYLEHQTFHYAYYIDTESVPSVAPTISEIGKQNILHLIYIEPKDTQYRSSVPVIQSLRINLEISKKLLLTRRCLADLINPLFLHTWISECWDMLYSCMHALLVCLNALSCIN